MAAYIQCQRIACRIQVEHSARGRTAIPGESTYPVARNRRHVPAGVDLSNSIVGRIGDVDATAIDRNTGENAKRRCGSRSAVTGISSNSIPCYDAKSPGGSDLDDEVGILIIIEDRGINGSC